PDIRRSPGDRERRLEDHGARGSVPRTPGANDRSLSGKNCVLCLHSDRRGRLQTRDKRLLPSSEGIQQMDIKRSGSQPSGKGPADYFTGTVRIEPLFQTHDPARALGVSVTFEPGARTAWHTHPLGQTLIVTAGCGLVQRWGGPVEEIRPGDVVWIPPGQKHWHGAAA